MRGKFATAVRAFLQAYAGAVVWVLAGCGWGMVIGSALEAAFGRGADGLLDAAGETSLEAVAGALLGMVGGTLLMAGLHVITLAPTFALMGKYGGRYPYGNASLGIMHERSARVGSVTGVVIALINGTAFFPLIGAGVLLESIHGRPVPCTLVQGCTLAGLLAGGLIGVVALGRTVWQRLPEPLREEVRRGMRQRARPA
jgi:hypothetical protein